MKSARFLMTLALVGLIILTTVPATNAQYPKWLHGATGFARAIELQPQLNISLVVYFYTDWCSYCRAQDNQYLSDPSVHRALQRTITVGINPEYGVEERHIAERLGSLAIRHF